jgi:hypothetical protein
MSPAAKRAIPAAQKASWATIRVEKGAGKKPQPKVLQLVLSRKKMKTNFDPALPRRLAIFLSSLAGIAIPFLNT